MQLPVLVAECGAGHLEAKGDVSVAGLLLPSRQEKCTEARRPAKIPLQGMGPGRRPSG